jgi:pyruvate carboxylase subunit B
MKFETTLGEKSSELLFNTEEQTVDVDGTSYAYEFIQQDDHRYLLRIGKQLFKLDDVRIEKQTVEFQFNGQWVAVDVRDEQQILMDEMGFKTAADLGEGELNAPMPGKILEIMPKEGDMVEEGEPVAILEAMKMENELKAPSAGIVAHIHVEVGQNVEKNEPILEIEAGG